MPAAAVPYIALAVAAVGTSYGIYAGQRAQSQAAQQYNEQKQAAAQQQQKQQQMLDKQTADAAALSATQTQAQKDAYAQQQKVQQDALAAAQAQIPVTQGQLDTSLQKSEAQAQATMNPQLEARLNALGLLQSGALPEAQAKYQVQLDSQRQQELANYGVNANTAVQQQALNYAGNDAGFLQNNLNQTLQNQSQTQANQFNSQDIAYQNNVAQQQYLANLQAAQTASQQAAANQYVNFGGQLAGGAMSYFSRPQAATSPVASGSGQPLNGIYSMTQPQPSGTTFDPFSPSGSTPYYGSQSYNPTMAAYNSYSGGGGVGANSYTQNFNKFTTPYY